MEAIKNYQFTWYSELGCLLPELGLLAPKTIENSNPDEVFCQMYSK